jgi:hypothetical protein
MHYAAQGDRMARRFFSGLCSLLLLAGACGDASSDDDPIDGKDGTKQQSSDPPTPKDDRVCADCVPFDPGGETSDFGSEIAACVVAYRPREVSAAQAEQLGFDVESVVDAMEQPIDAAFSWRASASKGGGPAQGFAPETHVHGKIEVRSFTYYELDETLCDGTTCTLEDGTQTEQASCPEHILFAASGELATDDGAIEATFLEQPVWMLVHGRDGEVSVAAGADLSTVHGTLRIDPAITEPHIGVLELSLGVVDSGQRGVLDVGVYPDWDHRSPDAGPLPSELAYYSPIEGRWGDWAGQDWPIPLIGAPQP